MREHITEAMQAAMREKNQTRLSTLRLIMAAIKDRDIASRSEDNQAGIDDKAILELFGKMIKQREDSAISYEDAGRLELAEQEREEIGIIREFMPKQLSSEETRNAIEDALVYTKANGLADMGTVIGWLKTNYAGQMDFGQVGKTLRDRLKG